MMMEGKTNKPGQERSVGWLGLTQKTVNENLCFPFYKIKNMGGQK